MLCNSAKIGRNTRAISCFVETWLQMRISVKRSWDKEADNMSEKLEEGL